MNLPQQMLRLSCDTAKERLDVASGLVRGPLLRAAALAELALGGHLRTAGGRVERMPGGAAPGDPFLAAVLAAAPAPRRWVDVIDEDVERAEEAVLGTDPTIRAGWRRRWGLVRVPRIVAAHGPVHALRERVRDAVLGGHDPADVPIADAVLAVLAADGGVAVTFGIREQHRHREAFRAIADRVEAALPGFREGALLAVAARRAAATEMRPRQPRTGATRVQQHAPRFC